MARSAIGVIVTVALSVFEEIAELEFELSTARAFTSNENVPEKCSTVSNPIS